MNVLMEVAAVAVLPVWAEYVRALAPAGAVVAGTAAAGIAWRAHRRQKRADRQEDFWRRLEWAVNLCLHGDLYAANIGMVVLTGLAQNKLVAKEDIAMMAELNEVIVQRVVDTDFDAGDDSPSDSGEDDADAEEANV